MIAPSEPIQHLVHELFSGNQHTLLAKARAEGTAEEKRARQLQEEHAFNAIRAVCITFNHLRIEATVHTTTGAILSAYVEGMVQGDNGLEYIDFDLIPPPDLPDPHQLKLALVA